MLLSMIQCGVRRGYPEKQNYIHIIAAEMQLFLKSFKLVSAGVTMVIELACLGNRLRVIHM